MLIRHATCASVDFKIGKHATLEMRLVCSVVSDGSPGGVICCEYIIGREAFMHKVGARSWLWKCPVGKIYRICLLPIVCFLTRESTAFREAQGESSGARTDENPGCASNKRMAESVFGSEQGLSPDDGSTSRDEKETQPRQLSLTDTIAPVNGQAMSTAGSGDELCTARSSDSHLLPSKDTRKLHTPHSIFLLRSVTQHTVGCGSSAIKPTSGPRKGSVAIKCYVMLHVYILECMFTDQKTQICFSSIASLFLTTVEDKGLPGAVGLRI